MRELLEAGKDLGIPYEIANFDRRMADGTPWNPLTVGNRNLLNIYSIEIDILPEWPKCKLEAQGIPPVIWNMLRFRKSVKGLRNK